MTCPASWRLTSALMTTPMSRRGCGATLRDPATRLAQPLGVPPWFSQVRDHRGMVSTARIRRSRATVYGPEHWRARKLAVAAYRVGDPCSIGGEPLTVAPRWLDLAHDHVNGGYLGLACRFHNRSEGATRGGRLRGPLPRAQRRAIAFKAGFWR
jgi:hypothetical protein